MEIRQTTRRALEKAGAVVRGARDLCLRAEIAAARLLATLAARGQARVALAAADPEAGLALVEWIVMIIVVVIAAVVFLKKFTSVLGGAYNNAGNNIANLGGNN